MRKPSKPKSLPAEELDRLFDEGNDISEYLDASQARVIEPATRHLDLAFPDWLARALDSEALRRGVSPQALINTWLIERMQAEARHLVKPPKQPLKAKREKVPR
jgi:hypothetical protein